METYRDEVICPPSNSQVTAQPALESWLFQIPEFLFLSSFEMISNFQYSFAALIPVTHQWFYNVFPTKP